MPASGRGGSFGMGRVLALLAIAVLAIVACVLLADVVLSYAHPHFDPLTTALHRGTWIPVLLIALVVLLVLALVLLLSGRSRTPLVVEGREGEEATMEFLETSDAQPGDQMLGCPACGTVFLHPMGGGPHFACPNCGRPGHLGTHHVQASLHSETCPKCGAQFQAYRDQSECPHCHAVLDRPAVSF